MYINKLQIKNYRNLHDFSIQLKPKTLIIGENNVGKTSLLKALSLLLNNEIGGIRSRVLRIEDFSFDVLHSFKCSVSNVDIDPSEVVFPQIEIIATFTDFIDEEEKTIVSEWHSNEAHTEAQLCFTFGCSLRNRVEWVKNIRDSLKFVEEKDRRLEQIQFPINEYESSIVAGIGRIKPENFQLRALKIDLLDALRDAKTELSASKENRLLYRILNNRDQNKFDDILHSASALNKSINKSNAELTSIKNEISKILGELSLETDISSNEINFRFSDISLQELLKKIGLEYGDKPISVENNGLGRNNLLFMSFVLSHVHSKNDDPDFRLIAIEEPEAHISPVLQKHFSESVSRDSFFQGGKRQVILTSHSTHICSHLNLENTVVIYKDTSDGSLKSHYILDGIPNDAEGKQTKNYLRKWLSATNSVMFFSRRLIFVEGIAEQILIPKFFELLRGAKPEKMNAQIINVNGLAFRNFLEVVKHGYFIKTAVLTDSDSGTRTKQRALDLKRDYQNTASIEIFITSSSTFEMELLEANKEGNGLEIIKRAVKKTRPQLYKTSLESCFISPLNTDTVFEAISEYKSEFAFNLVSELETDPIDFVVPKYISDALTFICEK